MRLYELAHARSGDKDTTADISVIAYRAADFPLLARELTARRVREHFAAIVRGRVERYELPQLSALKFVLHDTLGGVTRTLDVDIHGKSLASCLLELELELERSTRDEPAESQPSGRPPRHAGPDRPAANHHGVED